MQVGREHYLETANHLNFDEFSRRYKLLLHATDLAARRGFQDLLQELSQLLRELFNFNFLNYAVHDELSDLMQVRLVDESLQPADPVEVSTRESPAGWVWSQQQRLVISDSESDGRFRAALDLYASRGFHSLVILPISTARRQLGSICFGSATQTHYDDDVLYFLERLASLVGLALENSLSLDVAVIKRALIGEEEQLRELAAIRLELAERSAAAHQALRREHEQLETVLEIQGALAASRLDLRQMFPSITATARSADQDAKGSHLGRRALDRRAETSPDLSGQEDSDTRVSFANEQAQREARVEVERLQTILEISRALTLSTDSRVMVRDMSTSVRRLIAHDYTDLAFVDASADSMRIHALDFPEGCGLITPEARTRLLESPAGIAYGARRTTIFNRVELERIGSNFTKNLLAEGISSMCCLPLNSRGCILGVLSAASKKENAFADAEIELLTQIAPQVAMAVDSFRVFDEIASLKQALAKQNIRPKPEMRPAFDLSEIVGQSAGLASVLQQAKTVAPSDATVLILGETGTGKELIARAIHTLSQRSSAGFVKLNCAAIPTGLLESELFGHEKGAFTSAISQKVGRLELADKGTLFLDEVGEIPLELQPKLLRVLQDQEFERLGGTRTIRVNVRILAATNRDVSKAVANHEFRSDLYYRLHVFPVRLPSLRERPEDIPILVRHFVQKFARRMHKKIETIPAEAMRALETWQWPGNIRELENFMERSVILTEGVTLRVPVGELVATSEASASGGAPAKADTLGPKWTLEELERQYIVQALRQSGGVVAGSQGAAARLGMKRTTLQSKIQRLDIGREEYVS